MSDSGRVRAQFVAFLEAAEAGSEAALQSLRAFVAESDEAAELLCEDDALAVRFALVRSSRPPLSVGCRAAVPSPLAMRRGPRLVVLALHRGHFGSISLRSRASSRSAPVAAYVGSRWPRSSSSRRAEEPRRVWRNGPRRRGAMLVPRRRRTERR